jgi:hypothetical protein
VTCWVYAERLFCGCSKLKVKTQMIGSGKPQADKGGEKMYDGYVDCADAAALKQWIEDKEMEM